MASLQHLSFPIWNEPACGNIPLISKAFRNTVSEKKVFGTEDVSWLEVSVGADTWKQHVQLLDDVKHSIEKRYLTAKEEITEFLGENASSTSQDHVPKTPHIKARTRRGITKKRSSISQSVRRSSRRLNPSLLLVESMEVDRMSIATKAESVLQAVIENTPAKSKRGRKKKKQVDENLTTPQKSLSPVVEFSDCKNFVKPTPKTKVARKVSVRCKRSVLLHDDGTFDVVPAHETKRARKKSEKPEPAKLKPIKKSRSRKQSEQPKAIETNQDEAETSPNEPETNQDERQTNQDEQETKPESNQEEPVFEEPEKPTEVPTSCKLPPNSPEVVVVLTPIDQAHQEKQDSLDSADVVVMDTPVAEEKSSVDEPASCSEMEGDADTTSSSVCSSSAATIDLEDHRQTLMNPTVEVEQMETSAMVFTVPDSEDEEENHSNAEEQVEEKHVVEEEVVEQNSRRSTRKSRRSSKVLGGFAAKRRSTRQSLRNRTLQVAQIEEKTVEPTTVEGVETESEIEEIPEESHMEVDSHDEQHEKENLEPSSASRRPKPKIAKPVVRPKIKKPPPSVRSGSLKRTRAKIGASIAASNNSLMKTPSPPKQKKLEWNTPGTTKTLRSTRAKTAHTGGKLNRSTEASRAKRTPIRASPANARFTPGIPNLQFSNINTTFKSFILRNTPEKVNKEAELEAKKKLLEEKARKDEERQKQMEEQKQAKLLEQKRKREERAKRANQLREERERVEREKQDKLQDRWAQKIADADRCKNLRKVEEVAKMQSKKEKMAKAEAKRKEEEIEKLARLKEQEEEREKRLRQHQKEKKIQEEQRIKEKKLEEQREEQRRLEEERIQQQKLEEQKAAEEEEERIWKKREQEELDRLRRKRELEAAMEIAAKKKKQEDMKKLAEQREEARKEREAARQRRMEEKRLAKEEEKRQKEEQKRIKEAEKRAREEEKRRREEELLQQQEEERREEAHRIAQEKLEAEKEARREAARQKKELLRQKVEAERRIREEEEKQRRIKEEQERRLMLQKEKAEMQRKMEAAKLNSTYSKAAHTSALLEDSRDNYNMTPRGPNRPLLPSTNTDYVIEDLKSDDSTDNEDEPKKPIPSWAKGSALNFALIQQHHNSLSTADHVFHGLLEPVSLSNLFPNKIKARYFKRTSSAHWTSPIRPPGYTSFTSQCKGF